MTLTTVTPANKSQFVPLLENIIGLAEDFSEPSAQRLAFTFLGRCVAIWGQANPELANGENSQTLPGFDTFIYDRLVPLAFSVPSNPSFNIKDGQALVVSPHHVFLGSKAQRLSAIQGLSRDRKLPASARKSSRGAILRISRCRFPPFARLPTRDRFRLRDQASRL